MGARLKVVGTFAFLVAAFTVLCALGTWQVFRLQQDNRADQYREARVAAPPLDWQSNARLTAADLDFRRISVSGRWDNAHTFLLANRARYDMLGKDAVTPLLPDGGGPAVLVDRGWFPDTARDQVLAALAAEDRATVVGLARNVVGLPPGRETTAGDWTRLDPAKMGTRLPYPVAAWQLLQGRRETLQDDTSAPASWPVQLWSADGPAIPHLDYALTWYGLAVAFLVIAVLRFRRSGRRPSPASTAPASS